ncbi:MAG: hypothetical protein CMI95_05770 [Pelagibacteraceae bacterium]|nr:hypothetical protein [Pelagibacteraceae bacterium]|tara:strand:- start:16675 stop:18024 length:1350 start_codon:yes stop_codon:yes gene_type:complete
MKKVSIVGLGFVGFPTFLILSNIKKNNKYLYEVEGIEKDNFKGREIKEKYSKSISWIKSEDKKFKNLFIKAKKRKESYISNNLEGVKKSNIIIVSVNFEFKDNKRNSFKDLINLSDKLSKKINKKTLVIFETTFPPGTCDKIIIPIFKKNLKKRKIKFEDIYFCYSFERVMPGENYINSVTSNFRCYSGVNKKSKNICKKFLMTFVNYKKFKFSELKNIIDCETAKILENSYRATNIALIDEWTKISKYLKIDLNKIIEAIRLRNTHSNLMWPGLGVGGYCLTKDPNFIKISSKKFFKVNSNFPLVSKSIDINKKMYNTSLEYIKSKVHNLKNKKILICGLSYKNDTSDTRFSPTFDLISGIKSLGGKIHVYDPYQLSQNNNFSNLKLINKFNKNFNLIIFCVAHKYFKKLRLKNLKNQIIFDLNRVLTENQKKILLKNKTKYYCLGSN